MSCKKTPVIFKDFWRNRLSRYGTLLALLGLLVFLALPLGSKYLVRQWLLENGADTATIGKIRINPFTGRFSLTDVSVTRNGQTVLSKSSVRVDFGLRALFDREALLQSATLTDTAVEIERYDDGTLRIGSYRSSPRDEQRVGGEAAPWVFRAKEVGFSRVRIRYLDDGLRLDLFIAEGVARRFTTGREGMAGSLDLGGELNGAPLNLHLSALSFRPELGLEGRLDCSDFPLSSLAGVFGSRLTGLLGRLRAKTEISLKYDETGLVATFRGKAGLADIEVGGHGWAGSGGLALDGGLGFSSREPSGPRFDLDGLLLARPVSFAMPGKQLRLDGTEATHNGQISIGLGEAVTVRSDAEISVVRADFRLAETAVSAGLGTWSGTVDLDSGRGGEPMRLETDGGMELQGLLLAVSGSNLQAVSDSLSVDTDAALAFGAGPSYTGTSDMTAAGLRLVRGESALAKIGRLVVDRFSGGKEAALSVDAVVAETVDLPRSEVLPVRVSFDRGELRGATADESLADIDFSELKVHNPLVADGDPIAAADALELANGTFRDLEVAAESLRLGNGAFFYGLGGDPQQPLATVVEARGFPFAWSRAKGTQIGEVQADDLVVRYRKSRESERAPPSKGSEARGESKPIPLKIGSMDAGGESVLHYLDPTVEPPFRATVAVDSLNLSNIDLNRPEESISYTLEGMVDKYAPLSLRGSFAPLASPFRLEMAGRLRNYSLNSLSPYAVQAVGIALRSGQLDLTTELSVTGQHLNSDNRLSIKHIDISRENAERARSLEAGLPVPLETAVDMVSDRQGIITVSVPVDGRLSDLQVGVQDIVVTALRQTISQGIVPALAYTALGPTGALLYLGMKIGGAILDKDLPSLQFAPNRSDLSADQHGLLDSVGRNLQRKMQEGGTTYSICSQVVSGETEGEGEPPGKTEEERRRELYRLGEQRAQAVKQYLVRNFKLDPDRLFICSPTLTSGSARGTVEFRR